MTFGDWMNKVDTTFNDVTGLDMDSWPDQNYYDMYESELTPKMAVAQSVYNEYGEDGLEAFSLVEAFYGEG